MSKRKTVNVDDMKWFANTLLADPKVDSQEKMGIITMMEHILHSSNSYKGFMFLDITDTSYPSQGWFMREYL
jgi:hypothetical protein